MQRKHNKDIVPAAKMLRKNMTKEERRLWYDFLRTYPVRFSRQKVLGRYIVDFYCASAKLVVELDGSGHYTEEGKESLLAQSRELSTFTTSTEYSIEDSFLILSTCSYEYDNARYVLIGKLTEVVIPEHIS